MGKKNRNRKNLAWLGMGLALITCLAMGFWLGKNFEGYRFVRVVDGDTIVVRSLRNNEETRLRLMGIDAPDVGSCLFDQSTTNLQQKLEGKSLEYKILGRDGFGRFLGTVYINGVDVSEEMVSEGLARAYDFRKVHDNVKPSVEYLLKLQRIESEAREKKVGVWKGRCDK